MSTKIYNGMRIELAPGRGVFDLAADVRQALVAAARAQCVDLVADELRRIATSVDTASAPSTYVRATAQAITDLDAPDVGFLLFDPPGCDFLLGFPTGGTPSVVQRLLALPEVSEYGYWNNSDRPDDVSEAQWAQRRNHWSVVGYGPACDYGLSIAVSKVQQAPRAVAVTFTDDEWRQVAEAALRDRDQIAQTLLANAVGAWMSEHRHKEWGTAIVGDTYGALMRVHAVAEQLRGDEPSLVTVPGYDLAALRTTAPWPTSSIDDARLGELMPDVAAGILTG